jgi:hypothetical protein
MSNNINFTAFFDFGMFKEETNNTQKVKDDKDGTKTLRTLILSTNVNDYDTGK